MSDWLKLFPPHLVFLTVALVILPTIAAIFLRLTLYGYLANSADKVKRLITPGKSRGIQPSIVTTLEERFKEARKNLEQVNTAALIDGIYSQEQFSFFGFSFRCEQWDYFCRVLPNLLLAFGLLGTFLGITINLYNLSQTINQVDVSDVSILVQELQKPLQGMGIAFLTSLIAVACSSFLTIVNLRWNTSIAKYLLISSLEDYLDNVLQPTIEGHTRLDKSVNRMVEQQNEFLTRFHQNVTEAVESSLGQVAKQIADGNREATQLARQVYERFIETSGTLDRGATTFHHSALSLEKQVQNLTGIAGQVANSFQESSSALESGATIFLEASETIEQSKFSENLETITADLARTQREFSQSASFLGEHAWQIIESNIRANELAEQVYSKLQESSSTLQESATVFLEASQTIEQSQFADHLSAATADLASTHNRFAQSASVLNESTQSIQLAIAALQGSIQKMVHLGAQMSSLNQQSAQVIDLTNKRFATEEDSLYDIQSELVKLVETFKKHEEQINSGLQNLGDRLAKSIYEQVGSNNKQVQTVAEKIELYARNLSETKLELAKLVKILKENTEQLNINFQSLGNRLVSSVYKQIGSNNNRVQIVVEKVEQYVSNLSDIKSELSELVKISREQLGKQIVDGHKSNKDL